MGLQNPFRLQYYELNSLLKLFRTKFFRTKFSTAAFDLYLERNICREANQGDQKTLLKIAQNVANPNFGQH
jgi:hypothetical protein